MSQAHIRVHAPAVELTGAIESLFVERGLTVAHARSVAATLVEASLMGLDTHGIALLPTYLREIDHGRAKIAPDVRIVSHAPGTCLMDADDALGPVAGQLAALEATRRARECGIGAVAVARSNHFGAGGVHARTIASQGQIGIVLSNSDALVAPEGGRVALNGTNPLAVAAPGIDDDGFFLDMATSQVAYTRVLRALARGEIPPGWAQDAEGRDASFGGGVAALLPLGGYKGQGLGTMVQILCALLTAMPFDAELANLFTEPFDRPRNIGHFVIAIEIAAFVPLERFQSRMSSLLARFRDAPTAPGAEINVAGDFERRSRRERLTHGIPVPDELVALLSHHESLELAR